MSFWSPVIEKTKKLQVPDGVGLSFNTQGSTPQVRTTSDVDALKAAGTAVRKAVLPTKAEVVEDLEQEARQSLMRTPELAKQVDERLSSVTPQTGTFSWSKFMESPALDPTGIGGTLKRVEGAVIKALTKGSKKEAADAAIKLFDNGKGNIVIDPDALKLAAGETTPKTHEKYSQIAKDAYEEALKRDPNPEVHFLAGGTGSGKSENILRELADDVKVKGIIYDGTLANYKAAKVKLAQAEAAGKRPVIDAILPDIERAWRFAQSRGISTGRTVELDTFIEKHVGFAETIKKLAEEGYEIRLKDTRNVHSKAELADAPIIHTPDIVALLDDVAYDARKLKERLPNVKLTEKQQHKALAKAEEAKRASEAEEPGPSGLVRGERSAEGGGENVGRLDPQESVDATASSIRQQQVPEAELSAPSQTPDIPRTGGGKRSRTKDTSSSPRSVARGFRGLFTDVVEYIQNSEERVRQLVSEKTLDTSVDPYEIMTLYHGRVGHKIERGYAKAEEVAEDIILHTGRRKQAVSEGREAVNKYLQALHAPERNRELGDGAAGMSTEEAQTILKETPEKVKRIAEKALSLHRESLELLREAGVIGEDLYGTLRSKYQNHVPLQRILDEEDDLAGALSGRGFDVKSTGIIRAKGSDLQVSDILTNIVNNYEQAVLRAEKNIVDRATLAFVRNNAEDLSHIMEVKKPRSIGTSHEGIPLMERTQDPRILQLFEDGKPIWIKFKDQKLATAFRGVGREKLPVMLNAVGAITRFYAGLATRFNPEFALPNKIRDLQETMTFLASQGDIGFKGATKAALKDPASMKAVLDGVRGADTAGAKLYEEMRSLGGTTGGLGLSTRAQTELNIDRIFSIAKSRPRKAAQRLVEYVDNWNTIFEDSTRLSVYKTALANGATKERAAFLAKEASINFNRSGKGGPLINALWMFSNASIQGSTKMIRAMKNPKVAASVTAVMAGSVAAVSEWNDRVDPEWRDHVTEWDRLNSLPIVLPNEDGGVRYFNIPVSWGLKPILVMANSAYDGVSGFDVEPGKALGRVLSSVIDAYNPAGGTDFVSALSPTISDAPIEIARNQAWSGSLIRPIPYNNEPKDIQYFSSLLETAQGRTLVKATRNLEDNMGIAISPADLNYAIDQYLGGAGRSIKKTNELLYGLATDEDVPPADNWPFVSRFYRERTQEELGQGAGGEIEELKESLSDQARESFHKQEAAEATYKELKRLDPAIAAERFDILTETDPDTAKRIAKIAKDEKKGLTYQERLIGDLQVQNGERAKYLVTRFNELKGTEEKATLWEEYTQKGLITKEVSEQIRYLLNQ